MPRKASQAAKKDTTVESKNEGGTTRRSGRTAAAASKQESTKEATRSRRSSTAAQTAASVADSKTPKRSSSSRRDSTSPSESHQKNRRESVESPATRVKSTRRATSRINYKESDGEEEGTTPKYDENFESNEEFDESESDEKNKSKGRTRAPKLPAKGRKAKDKPRASRGRRGRPSKKQSSDEDEPIELSEESVEIESETIGKKSEESSKETTRSGRSRKSKTETEAKPEGKPKSSRRSARASAVKEEPPKKRPSRSLQAKKYTEDDEDDDDIEEIHDSKAEEDDKPQDSPRKRKRGSTTETSKRLKEEESTEDTEKGNDTEETADKGETKPTDDSESEKEKKEESADEQMEVEASGEGDAVDGDKEKADKETEQEDKKTESPEDQSKSKDADEPEDEVYNESKEKLNFANKQDSVDSSENLDESMHSFDSDQGSRAEQSVSSGLEDSQDTKETKGSDNMAAHSENPEKTKSQIDYQPDSSNSFQELNDSSESKSLNETNINSEQKQESVTDKSETNPDLKTDASEEKFQTASSILQEKADFDKTVVPPVSSVLGTPPHSKESVNELSLNGSEKVSNSAQVIHSTSSAALHSEDSAPKANGAHDLHNSVPENNQYYPFPGRKYVINTKLGDSIRQSVKDKSFGFVSYNLGISSPDSSIQKEKLLNELNKLDAHIICIQQVSKSFYCGILEPSLDALGFKGTFSQPEETEKGMATFYKSSLFRLSGHSEASLKHLVEKELEASSLDASDRMAVKSYVKKCGHVLFTHFATVIGMHSLTVANVQVPPTDLSIHALQVSCLVREVVRLNGGTSRPYLLGGEFNMLESEAPYQLLRDGYLSNDMIEELQRRKDVVLPGKENAALVNLLWKSFQHPSSTLCSCYKSVLDHEIFIPEQKITSQDLLWYSSDSLYTVGVLDSSETLNDHHFSLKADIAFTV